MRYENPNKLEDPLTICIQILEYLLPKHIVMSSFICGFFQYYINDWNSLLVNQFLLCAEKLGTLWTTKKNFCLQEKYALDMNTLIDKQIQKEDYHNTLLKPKRL